MKEQPFESISREPMGKRTALVIENLSFLGNGPYSFSVAAGDCVGLSGRSGIGKSQLLRAFVDLIPHQGEIYLNGTACSVVPAPQWRKQLALVPAESVWWYDTVADHFPDAGHWVLTCGWLERLGFSAEVMSWQVSRLSTGERQRLALLRALVNEPLALLLDEPTSGLDPFFAGRYEGIVDEYRRSKGAALVWVTHDREQLLRVADNAYLFEKNALLPLPVAVGGKEAGL